LKRNVQQPFFLPEEILALDLDKDVGILRPKMVIIVLG
jgi:hypothetical protein